MTDDGWCFSFFTSHESQVAAMEGLGMMEIAFFIWTAF